MQWKQRDSFALKAFEAGAVPPFLKTFRRVRAHYRDSTGANFQAEFYVSPDYFSIGTSKDWARVPLTPMTAQQMADRLHCFLPTKKMVDDIWLAASIRPEPIPMYAFRDSTPVMWRHHLIVEGQRAGRKGLIAGIKKDVVISGKVSHAPKADRVAIYGWHTIYNKPVQPLYAGHVNWYVDYSHGIRMVWHRIRVKRPGKSWKWMEYTSILQDPVLQRLLCDEPYCDFFRYPY